jgi:hypothetical protein
MYCVSLSGNGNVTGPSGATMYLHISKVQHYTPTVGLFLHKHHPILNTYVHYGRLVRFRLFARYMYTLFECLGKVYAHRAHRRIGYTVHTSNRVHSVFYPYVEYKGTICRLNHKDVASYTNWGGSFPKNCP